MKNSKISHFLIFTLFSLNLFSQIIKVKEDSTVINYFEKKKLISSKIMLMNNYSLVLNNYPQEKCKKILYFNDLGKILFSRKVKLNEVTELTFYNEFLLKRIINEKSKNIDVLNICESNVYVCYDDFYNIKYIKIEIKENKFKWMIFDDCIYKYTIYE